MIPLVRHSAILTPLIAPLLVVAPGACAQPAAPGRMAAAAQPATAGGGIFTTPLQAADLDPAAYVQWVDGQESPITLLRAIEDTGLDNIGVNLDTANLILYGKGEPVGALDVIGKYVRGLHAKDGLYPTDPKKLGQEVPIGQGRVNFSEVIRKLHQLAYTGPITIERETSGAQQEADIRASITFLDRLIASSYA